MYFRAVLLLSAALPGCLAVPYSEYILAPDSRTIYAASVYQVNGTVTSADALVGSPSGSAATFQGPSSVTLDFGKNIAGVVSVLAGNCSSSDALLWLTYTESSIWISSEGSDGMADAGLDAPLSLPVGNGPNNYTVDRDHERGGFRYLTLFSNTSDTVEITGVSIDFTAAPQQDLQAYTGYFHCNDDLINRIWYAGAYTNQLCSIDPVHGDSIVHLGQTTATPVTWYLNTTVANGSSCLVDGAKRDRLVWPGDMAISLDGIAVSTLDMGTINNSIQSLFALQQPDGRLPYVGVPLGASFGVSFTYHLFNLVAIAGYYSWTGDMEFLQQYWSQYKMGLEWSLSSIDSSGLMDVTAAADWLRVGMGGHNIEANAILYYTINQGLVLAGVLNDSSTIANWTSYAEGVKSAANSLLWDGEANLYKDNETATLYPQDGNSWAVRSNLTQSAAQSQAISSALKARWTQYGAPAPEGGSTPAVISPFIGGFELMAHYAADEPQSALDLLRLQWGFMLDDPRMTNSTFIEGYSADGSLHYAPYSNDPRVSHAHGWSTGPTSVLSFFAAGIQLKSAQGQTWRIAPAPADLTSIDAGFSTGLGTFSCTLTTDGSSNINSLNFTTPAGTEGEVSLGNVSGSLVSSAGQTVALTDGTASGLAGGTWTLQTSK